MIEVEDLNDDVFVFVEQYRMRNRIGAHSHMPVCLSGAFSYCLMKQYFNDDIKNFAHDTNTFDKNTYMVRLEKDIGFSRKRQPCLDALFNILGNSLRNVNNDVIIEPRDKSKSKLLVSFPTRNFPQIHKDQGNVDSNAGDFRILWDFCPQGRILYFEEKTKNQKSLFLENCGVEVCSRQMCGNEVCGELVSGQKRCLYHQGWDRGVAKGRALVTALLETRISGGAINMDMKTILSLFQSSEFNRRVRNEMESFVYNSINEWNNSLDELLLDITDQNCRLSDRYAKFETDIGLNREIPITDYSADEKTREFLTEIFLLQNLRLLAIDD